MNYIRRRRIVQPPRDIRVGWCKPPKSRYTNWKRVRGLRGPRWEIQKKLMEMTRTCIPRNSMVVETGWGFQLLDALSFPGNEIWFSKWVIAMQSKVTHSSKQRSNILTNRRKKNVQSHTHQLVEPNQLVLRQRHQFFSRTVLQHLLEW